MASARSLFVSLRPEQWTKNFVVFAALLFGEKLTDPSADARAVARTSMGRLRAQLGRDLGLVRPGTFGLTWVTEFPGRRHGGRSSGGVACAGGLE